MSTPPKRSLLHGVNYYSYEINLAIRDRAHFLALTNLGDARTGLVFRKEIVRPQAPRRRAPRCQ